MTDYTNDDELGALLRAEVPEPSDTYWGEIQSRLADATEQSEPANAVDITSSDTTVVPFRERLGRGFGGLAALVVAASLLLIVGLLVGTRLQRSNDTIDAGYASEPALMSQAKLDQLPGPRQNMDHWHAVYGVWDCTANDGAGDWIPKFESTQDDTGIHSHGDGMIYIHPFFEHSAGVNATLSHFINEMQLDLTDTALTLDDGRVLQEGVSCNGSEAVLHLRRWQLDTVARTETVSSHRTITENLNAERFYNDREVWVLALAPLDADLPLPPTDRFVELDAWSNAIEYDPALGTGFESPPRISTRTMQALDADLSQSLSAPPGPVTELPSNVPTTVLSELTSDPRPDWTDSIVEFTFRPVASARIDAATFAVLASFEQRNGSDVSRCTAAIDVAARQPLALICEPATEPAAGLAILEQSNELLMTNVATDAAYVVAETVSGVRIATNPLERRSYIGFNFDDDPIMTITFYDAALQPTLDCARERPGGFLDCVERDE